MIERSHEEIRQALDDLLKSDGWEIHCALVREQYSAERQLAQIDGVIASVQPSEIADAQAVILPQIRAAAKAAIATLELPKSRMSMVAKAEKKEATGFDRFRRIPGKSA